MTSAPPRGVALAVLLALATACASSSGGEAAPGASPSVAAEGSSTTATLPTETESTVLGPDERPARLVAPDDVTTSAPLLVLLHGYTSDADRQDAYLGVTE
jgi:poly(3-hydroxybutyrate) depolymerase